MRNSAPPSSRAFLPLPPVALTMYASDPPYGNPDAFNLGPLATCRDGRDQQCQQRGLLAWWSESELESELEPEQTPNSGEQLKHADTQLLACAVVHMFCMTQNELE